MSPILKIWDGTTWKPFDNQFNIVNVRHYGAKGDGVTDDTAAIQAAIDAANTAGGGTVYFPTGIFRITVALELKSNVYLDFAPGSIIDMTGVSLQGSYRYGIRAIGTVGDSIVLTSDAIKGQYSFNIASTSGLNVGDYIQLATQGVNFYPYGQAGYNIDRGEIKRIRSISGNTITTEEALYDTYTVANGAFVKKVNFIENIAIRGARIIGDAAPDSQEMGIYLQYVNGFTINDCELENQDLYQIGLVSCIRGSVINNRLRQSFYDGVTGTIFYAIAVASCCQWLRIIGNHAERTRHCVVTTAFTTGQGLWGKPRFIIVEGNVAKDMMGGGAGRSWAYEHHGVGDTIIFANNTADGCYGGFNIEGGGVIIANNVIRNWYKVGISVDNEAVELHDVQIIGNQIADRTTEGGGSATARPIEIFLQDGDTVRNLCIENNVIEHDLTVNMGIMINASVPINAENCVIEGNVIRNVNANVGSNYGIGVTNLNNVVIKANNIFDSYQGIYAGAEECVIADNEIDVLKSRTLTAGYCIYTDKPGTWIDNNRIRRSYVGIRIATGATGAVVVNNIIRSDSATISDAETGTTKVNNVEIVY